MAWFAGQQKTLDAASQLLGAHGDDVVEKLRQMLDRQKRLERELESFKAKATAGATTSLLETAHDLGGVKLIVARMEGLDGKALRDAVDMLKERLGNAVIILASATDGKAALVAGVGGSALGKVKAGELMAHVAGQIGGKGGGRPDMAQGGGQDGPALSRPGGCVHGARTRSMSGRCTRADLRHNQAALTSGRAAHRQRGAVIQSRAGARKYRRDQTC